MCNLAMEKICIALFVCFVFVNTEVTLQKRGYDVLVTFSQNVKSSDGKMLLQKMKSSLNDASRILWNAIERRFMKVTFRIPDTWNTSEWNITIDKPRIVGSMKTDFLISGTNNVVFGKFPFAEQYGSCGTPGHQIIIPTDFFADSNIFAKGMVLSREWLKYRYGVFDENGFIEDPLYPMYYNIPGNDPNEVKITDCTNYPVKYNFTDRTGEICTGRIIDRVNSKECVIEFDEKSVESVTSSIMYFQEDISVMRHICGKDPAHVHNAESPNKHNAMCRGKSVWDVLKMSEDFQGETHPEDFVEIKYVYEKGTQPKVIVVWENTAKVNKTMGAAILKVIKRIVYDLPSGSKFNGFPFADTLSEEKDYDLRKLNSLSDKNSVMAFIRSDFVKNADGNISIAISKALDVLSSDSSDSELERTVIVITKSSGTPDQTLFERLEDSKVCVMFLYLTEDTVPDEVKNYVSALPCGTLEVISIANNDKNMFINLFSAMETILPKTVADKIVETAETGYLSKESPISLEVGAAVETITFWLFTNKESENFELKFNGMKEKFKQMEITEIMALSFSPKESGSIEFTYPHTTDPIFVQVRVTFKAGKYLKGDVLTHDTSEKSSPDQMPVIIYAIIRYGDYPVQKAKVQATVERPNGKEIQFEMFDDGKGDPDITQNDGIYSRYFTKFTEKGKYTVTVTVETKDSTSYGIVGKAEYKTCCGSFVQLMPTNVPTSSKKLRTTFTAKNGRPSGGYKPSRILDFKITEVTDDKIVLKWSAPGEEGDSGTVQSYEIKRFISYEEATNDQNGTVLNYTFTPRERGVIETLELVLSDSEERGKYYITITAKNSKQSSDSSNVLEISIPYEETTTTTTTTTDKVTDETNNTKLGGTSKYTALTIGLVVGIILICLIFFFLVLKSKRKEKEKENSVNHTAKRDENVLNPINS